MKIASWNVNGIRACFEKGFLEWLESESPDIAFLQETKALPEQFPKELLEHEMYELHAHSAKRKGYSGTAVFIKKGLEVKKVHLGIGVDKFDDEGRAIEVELENTSIYGCYFPNGSRDHSRVPYKLEFYDELLKQSKAKGKSIVITGDFNTAHNEIDLKNPKSNHKSTGFLPEERAWIDKYLDHGYVDIFRELHKDEADHYTWWTYRMNCRAKNVGWRLDYYLISDDLRDKTKDCYNRTDVLGSDHCPVILELNI